MLSQLPNLLTLLRIAASPVLVLLLEQHYYDLAFLLFILAGITDGLDGYIAKRFNFESRLGAILDPLADKLLLISAFVMLTLVDELPFWLLIVVVFRDLLIISGYLVLIVLYGSVPMNPTRISKLNTVTQLTLVTCVIFNAAGWLPLSLLVQALMYIVLLTTIASGAHYVWVWGIKQDFENQDENRRRGDS